MCFRIMSLEIMSHFHDVGKFLWTTHYTLLIPLLFGNCGQIRMWKTFHITLIPNAVHMNGRCRKQGSLWPRPWILKIRQIWHMVTDRNRVLPDYPILYSLVMRLRKYQSWSYCQMTQQMTPYCLNFFLHYASCCKDTASSYTVLEH